MQKPTVRPPQAAPDEKTAFVGNAADAGQVREAKKRAKLAEKELLNDMVTVLDLPAGRRLVKHYLGFCGVFRGGRSPDDELRFNEGMRNVGLKLLHHVEQARPDLISIMRD